MTTLDRPRWENRHKDLHETILLGPAARKILYDLWFRLSHPDRYTRSCRRVLQWQVDIGRALLDWPDVDRDSVKARLAELQPLLAQPDLPD